MKKVDLNDLKLRKLAKNVVLQAQKKNLIKPILEAFKDIPATEEIHKGKKEYFINCKEWAYDKKCRK